MTVDVGQVGGLPAQSRTVVHDLELHFLVDIIDNRHGNYLLKPSRVDDTTRQSPG